MTVVDAIGEESELGVPPNGNHVVIASFFEVRVINAFTSLTKKEMWSSPGGS
jgi:hypothetical protein